MHDRQKVCMHAINIAGSREYPSPSSSSSSVLVVLPPYGRAQSAQVRCDFNDAREDCCAGVILLLTLPMVGVLVEVVFVVRLFVMPTLMSAKDDDEVKEDDMMMKMVR
jgi:hypothetical protein